MSQKIIKSKEEECIKLVKMRLNINTFGLRAFVEAVPKAEFIMSLFVSLNGI